MGLFGLGNKEVMYFPGCYSLAFLEDKITNYERILKKLGLSFSIQTQSMCCGGFLEENGYEKQLRKKSRENLDNLNKQGIKKIITSCALCHKILSQNYGDMLPDWKIESENIIITILKFFRQDPKLIKVQFYEPILYLDSCYLSRYLGITEEPREILQRLGFEVIDLPYNKEESLCEGSCGNLRQTNQELAKKIALVYLKKVLKFAEKNKIKKIVSADPRQYHSLKELFEEIKPKDRELLEFSDIICDSLRIRRD